MAVVKLMLEQYCVIYFEFLYFHQSNYKTLVCNCRGEFDR